jgi:hypothetical protein
MPENYLAPYQNKQLNQVVIPGSHDAGVFRSNLGDLPHNVQTQELDIANQAHAGVRWFDLRIATRKKTQAERGQSPGQYEQRAYHLDGLLVRDNKAAHRGGPVKSHQNVGLLGGWGDTLERMLGQAKAFVEGHPQEFLILKISKSYNLPDVIKTCVDVLGKTHYKPAGNSTNLNTQTVGSLGGKVITLFSEGDLKGVKVISGDPAAFSRLTSTYRGCLTYRELFDAKRKTTKPYLRDYDGLQYFGKFSSTADIGTNTSAQTNNITTGAMACDKDAMGMMYWTTTGLRDNIRTRNDLMWQPGTVRALKELWNNGLKLALHAQMGREKTYGDAIRNRYKSFMPNIVMMDFADDEKCKIVRELNDVANQQILEMHEEVRDHFRQQGWYVKPLPE